MNAIPTRRRFIAILPVAGAALLAACSPKPEPTPVAPSPAAPVAETPPPAPTPAPVPASAPVAAPTPAAAPATAPVAPTSLPMLDEKDTQAMALGYAADATQTNKDKYKNYVAGSQCSNCTLFQGQAGEASGGCPIFPGKKVNAKGWCASWVKRA